MSDTNGSEAIGANVTDLKAVGDAVRQVGEKARDAGADAIEQAKDIAGDVQNHASSLLGAAAEKATSVADEQKENVADYLDDVAKAVHRSSQELKGHQDWIAQLVERGAAELGTVATALRNNDLQSMLGELGSLAKRQPALFVGASLAAGFALTRVGRLAAGGASAPPGGTATAPASTDAGTPEASDERR